MSFLDNIKNAFGSNGKGKSKDCVKVDNFSDLKEAIENDVKHICLEADILFKREIMLDGDDLTIDGNGHTLDAEGHRRFFTINGNNITFRSVTFKNGFSSRDYGRPPAEWGEKNVEYRGGAIYNNGSCSFYNCDFFDNSIGDRMWYDRSRGNIHLNYIALGVSIFSSGECFTYSCHYRRNLDCGGITGANYGVTVKEEDVEFPNNPVVEDNDCESEFDEDVELEDDYYDDLWEKDDDSDRNVEIISEPEPSDNVRDFEYLQDLIHSGVHEIVLDSDIVLDENKTHDVDGILLNADNLIIDGNNHTIDACGKSRIFNIARNRNIIIKSLTIKNGYNGDPGKVVGYSNDRELISKSYGGAIYTRGQCIFMDCNFIGNRVGNSSISLSPRVDYVAEGAAIYGTDGSMSHLISCSFKDNEEIKKGKFSKDIRAEHLKMDCDWGIDCAYFLLKQAFYGYLDIIDEPLPVSIGESLNKKIRRSIDGGATKIVLDRDYVVDSPITLSNIEIDANNHKISAGNSSAIFECFRDVTLKNMTLENAQNAISNSGNLKLVNVTFSDCFSSTDSAAIYNEGDLEMTGCSFHNNISLFDGSAISNNGHAVVSSSEFSDNRSMLNTISNRGYMEIYSGTFRGNLAKHVISNEGEGKSHLANCRFEKNTTALATIQNEGLHVSINNIAFRDNLFKKDASFAISNNARMKLDGIDCDGGARILNMGKMYITGDAEDLIDNRSSLSKSAYDDDKFDFSYLDRMIHESESSEIVLEHDISFEDYEMDYYEGGIELDIDGLTIDGGGKTIDARGLSRIFIITAKNVSLKNIEFKNGHSFADIYNPLNESGGALRINSGVNVLIENCRFSNNVSENDGGAIHQKGRLDIVRSSFSKNTASNKGGALLKDYFELDIRGSRFAANKAEYGGAVYMDGGVLTVSDSSLNKNGAKWGGAIFNRNGGELNISDSKLNENRADQGGAIDNRNGDLTISGSEMIANVANICGGAIHESFGSITITKSTLNDNKANKYKNMSTFAQKGGDFSYSDIEWDHRFQRTSRRSFF